MALCLGDSAMEKYIDSQGFHKAVLEERAKAAIVTGFSLTEGGSMSPLLTLLLGAMLCPHILGLSGGTAEPETVTPEDPNNRTVTSTYSLAHSNTDFAFSLYKLLATQKPENNVIFSPFSVSAALALLALGARSTTKTEILQGLKFNLTQTPEAEIHQGFQLLLSHLSRPGTHLQLNMSTAIFVDQQLHLVESFQQEAQTLYTADAFPTNFQDPPAAEKLINDYVKQKTQGKIQELVKDLDAETMMVLVNCLFFKAKWKAPFDPHDTITMNFHVNESRVEKVPMMTAEDTQVLYFRDEARGSTLVQLPYSDSRACALFILPDQGRMAELEAALNPSTFQHWRDSMSTRIIDLKLPKFSISGEYDLEKNLPDLGIHEVFSKQADLTGLTGSQNLHVSQVVHKARLDVAENGTEAAAATGIHLVFTSAKWDQTIVTFNRPFLVTLISEDTQGFLFLGKVANPLQA
ncbi:serine protease inhibitor A3N-like [Suncus etruscus]|uniref:serine protease inhibitor A3N-like n=1 Tax=Suncus etruscus TaxID=109475 RepID=UPI00210FAE98|nr:serine protease inhibitor A3N-like [Suncus etruscus]